VHLQSQNDIQFGMVGVFAYFLVFGKELLIVGKILAKYVTTALAF
jgi:hypothetical protein